MVNIYTYSPEHFEQQAINIKKLYFQYKARVVAIDANGVGAGLVDFLVIGQEDPESGEYLPPFGVENDDDGKYRKMRTGDTVPNALYLIKANAPINTEMYSYAKVQMYSGKVKFLIDEATAKSKLVKTKLGQVMTNSQITERLRPFILTTALKEQMMNLIEENEGINIILKQDSKAIKKDKFSAFIYGLYYIKQQEDSAKKRKKFNIGDLMFMN